MKEQIQAGVQSDFLMKKNYEVYTLSEKERNKVFTDMSIALLGLANIDSFTSPTLRDAKKFIKHSARRSAGGYLGSLIRTGVVTYDDILPDGRIDTENVKNRRTYESHVNMDFLMNYKVSRSTLKKAQNLSVSYQNPIEESARPYGYRLLEHDKELQENSNSQASAYEPFIDPTIFLPQESTEPTHYYEQVSEETPDPIYDVAGNKVGVIRDLGIPGVDPLPYYFPQEKKSNFSLIQSKFNSAVSGMKSNIVNLFTREGLTTVDNLPEFVKIYLMPS